jgi:flagellar biosynthesis GTPase FlhF
MRAPGKSTLTFYFIFYNILIFPSFKKISVGAMKGKKSVYSNINKLLVEYKSDRKTTMDKLREELKIEEKKKESKEEKRLQLLENLFDGEPGEDEPIVKEEKEEEKQGEDSEEENEEEEEQGEGSDEEEESEEKGKEGQQQQQPQEKPEEKKPEEKKEETKPDMSVAMMRSLINEDIFHINKQDGDGNTPLMIACQKGQTEIVQLLLDQGDLKPDLVNNKGETALFLACWWNKPLCISALLKRPDVNIDLAPTERDPPIIVVAYNGLLEGVKAFLQSNRDDLKLDKTFWIWKDEKNQKVDLGEFLNHKFHKHNKESAEKHHERTEHYPEIIKLSENYIAAHQTLVEFVLSLVNANE